ncbi:hypothetical protein B23_3190 [Geobacillus thermoleovorans B23]|nr:hypothetical protein B23_3190 [Geobacillus thermoleovorans B23]
MIHDIFAKRKLEGDKRFSFHFSFPFTNILDKK